MKIRIFLMAALWLGVLWSHAQTGAGTALSSALPVFLVAALFGEAVLTSPESGPWAASLIKLLSSFAMNVKKSSVAGLDFLF